MLDYEHDEEEHRIDQLSRKEVVDRIVAQLSEEALTVWAEAMAKRGVRIDGRRRLPSKRPIQTQHAKVCGLPMFLSVGFYPDGKAGELFVDITKEGGAIRGLIHAFAMLFSMALQYGAPLEVLIEQFSYMRFLPDGAVEGDDRIAKATSVLDYVVRHLAVHVLGREDLVSGDPPVEAGLR